MSILPINESPIKLEGTELSVFYMPRPGKPDPNAPWVPGEARPRVPQDPQQGDTCWYDGAIQPLRLKIGKNHPPLENCIKARQFEKKCYNLRKGMILLGRISHFIEGVASSNVSIQQTEQHILGLLTQAQQRKEPSRVIKKLAQIHHAAINATEVVKRFQRQTKIQDLATYNKENNIQKEAQLDLQFLREVGVDPVVMYVNFTKKSFLDAIFHRNGRPTDIGYMLEFEKGLAKTSENLDSKWELLSCSFKRALLERFRIGVILQRSGFHPSCWEPSHKIDQLIKALNTEGPLSVSGYFGPAWCHREPTQKITKWDRSVHGWEDNDLKTKEEIKAISASFNVIHAVMIIGAEKLEGISGGGMVYYADPNIGSNPKAPQKQLFFRITYQNLVDHIYPKLLIPTTPQTGFELANSVFEKYAFYCVPEEAVFPNQEEPVYELVNVCVNITMAPGSRLGICFAPSWDIPIACRASRSQENKWYGSIFRGVEFRLVKINPDRTVEPEKMELNRILAPHWPAGKGGTLNNVKF
jgi:hypothetical protein